MSNTTTDAEEQVFNATLVIAMAISSYIGIFVVGGLMFHMLKHLILGKDSKISKFSKLSSIAVFFSFFITCAAYGFLKIDLVQLSGPQHIISCDIGYISGWWAFYLGKICLFGCFVARIDMTFRASALAYNRIFLVSLVLFYTLLQASAMVLIFYYGIFMVGTELVNVPSLNLGVCSSKFFEPADFPIYQNFTLSYGLCEIFSQFLICFLFVSRLRRLVKLAEHPGDHNTLSRTSSERKRDDRLRRVMYKQTILVIICTISALIYIGAAYYAQSSFLVPVDCVVNAICVWFMFRFADPIWNFMVSTCCCCVQCIRKEGPSPLMQRMHSMSSRVSQSSMQPYENSSGTTTPNANNAPRIGVQSAWEDNNISNYEKPMTTPKMASISLQNQNDNNDLQRNSSTANDLVLPTTPYSPFVKSPEQLLDDTFALNDSQLVQIPTAVHSIHGLASRFPKTAQDVQNSILNSSREPSQTDNMNNLFATNLSPDILEPLKEEKNEDDDGIEIHLRPTHSNGSHQSDSIPSQTPDP